MKEYLFLLRGGKPAASKSEEENKAEMEAWGAYMGRLTQKGQLSGGLPLVPGGITVTGTKIIASAVTSAKEGIVGGYLIVKAASAEEAADLAQDCPHIASDGNIEVREIAPMPEM